MASKRAVKRLQGRRSRQSLPRVSTPPEKLKFILSGIENLPPVSADLDLPKISESLADLLSGRITVTDMMVANPELRELSPDVNLRDYLQAVVMLQWAKQLRMIAKGRRKGFIEVMYKCVDGEFQITRDPFIDALNSCGKKHDLRHLRECAVETCRKVFWAKKLTADQLTDPKAEVGCSEKCKNILRVRRWRRSQPEATANTKPRLPSIDAIEAVKRVIKNWRPQFIRTAENVKVIAEDQEISVDLCNAIIDHLEKSKD